MAINSNRLDDFLKQDYDDFKAPDFALDSSFIKWVRDNDPEAGKFWREWLKKNPDREEDIQAARSLVLALQFREEEVTSRQIDSEWKKHRGSSGNYRLPLREGHKGVFFSSGIFTRAAAILLLAATFTFVAHWLISRSATEEKERLTLVKTTPKGQKLSIVLPDGTEIKLNSDSRIEYPSQFTGDTREVTLEGEAYFDVVHNAQKPFKVYTGSVITTVLGTSFNVNAYSRNTDVRIALVEGKVRVNTQKQSGSVSEYLLSPSEMITINKKQETSEISRFSLEEITGWKEGYLFFEKTAFVGTIEKLERWYGVKFEIMPDVKIDPDWLFSGKFQNKSLGYVLGAFSYPDLFKYKIEERKVTIYN